jgi:lipopolysaccharide transport system ATP-binding protein
MPDVHIEAEGLGKAYRRVSRGAKGGVSYYRTIQEDLVSLPGRVRQLFHSDGSRRKTKDETFWALSDVSFRVNQGEVLGIIGRNGAGKSTLLKILSRITEPTTGLARIYGRVGSLLEVGTGFHAELTGRENIYLSGAILGMRRHEIAKRFDEIVEFAEVQQFVDTPVKRYSSGMYMRLAFAVAAHLDTEILLVDEVLAVGDGSFQKKCLGKMEDVSHEGRTVLFVSHSMSAITRLCPRTILLDNGRVVADGPSQTVIGTYLQSGAGTTAVREWTEQHSAPGNDIARLCAVRARTEEGVVLDAFDIRRPIGIEMEYDVLQSGHVLVPNFHVLNDEGAYVFVAHDHDPTWWRRPRPAGHYTSTAWIPGNFLAEGTLVVGAAVSTHDPVIVHFYEQDAIAFQVVDSLDGDSARGDYAGPMPGIVRPLLKWMTTWSADQVVVPSSPESVGVGEGAAL